MYKLTLTLLLMTLLSSCGFFGGLSPRGQPDSAPAVVLDPATIEDAVPRVEPRSRGGNKSPYTVFGKRYKVVESTKGYRERGDASWYGVKFHGNHTSNGEVYDMYQMTAAHKHLPLPSYVRVKNLENDLETIVRVNDRGPFHQGRIIDLSYAAAAKLDVLKKGTAKVEIEVIDPKQWARAAKKRAPSTVAVKTTDVRSTNKKPVSPDKAANQSMSEQAIYLQVAALNSLPAAQQLQQRLLGTLATIGGVHADTNVVIHPTESGVYRVRIGPLIGGSQLSALRQHDRLTAFGNMYAVNEPL